MIKQIDRNKILEDVKNNQRPDLPYSQTLDSGKPGPHIFIAGAIHGNETAGVLAFLRLKNIIEQDSNFLNKGKITFCLGNPEAFRTGQRFIDYNLNRAFLPNLDLNLYETQRAVEITNFLKNSNVDFILDLHSISIGDFKLAVYTEPSFKSTLKELSNLSNQALILPDITPGTLVNYANKLNNCQGMLIECGNHNDQKGIDIAFEHILQVLGYYQMCQKTTKPKVTSTTTYIPFLAIKPNPGFRFLIDDVKTGTYLPALTKYATSDLADYFSPIDCYLFIPDAKPKPTDADAGFLSVIRQD